MTEPTRAKSGRRPRRSASQLFIAALVAFGVVASVLLLFSENIQWLRVGLVSALWAAIIGAFAMTKYRRDAAADQTKAKDLQTVYELQLAREIAARREYELNVEARIRSEVQLESSEIAALRAELAHLRNNLQMLFDGNLPTERVALRAEAIRIQELGGGRNYDSYQPAPSGLYIPGRSSSPNGNGAPGDSVGGGDIDPHDADNPTDIEPLPGLSTPNDEPVTAETSVLYPETPIGSEPPPGYTADRPSYGSQPRDPRPYDTQRSAAEPRSQQPSDRDANTGRRVPTPPRAAVPFGGVSGGGVQDGGVQDGGVSGGDDSDNSARESATAEPANPEPATPEPTAPETKAAEPVRTPSSNPEAVASEEAESETDVPEDAPSGQSNQAESRARRRRRSDSDSVRASGAHSNGRSVADILAGMQSGSNEPSERRHRRRAD